MCTVRFPGTARFGGPFAGGKQQVVSGLNGLAEVLLAAVPDWRRGQSAATN
jgi:hypothetical protein